MSVDLAIHGLLFRDMNFIFCVSNGLSKLYTKANTNLTSVSIIYIFLINNHEDEGYSCT